MRKLILLSIVCLSSWVVSAEEGFSWCTLCYKPPYKAVALLMEEHAHSINMHPIYSHPSYPPYPIIG